MTGADKERAARRDQIARDLKIAEFRLTLGSRPVKGGWKPDGASASLVIPVGRKKRSLGVNLILKSFLDRGMMPSSMTPIGRDRVRLFWQYGDVAPECGELVRQFGEARIDAV